MVSALALRIARRRWRRARLRSSPELRRRLAEQLDEAAERLAHEVRARCEREEAARRLSHPRPLAVHWLASAAHSDHWANVREGRSDEPLDLSGTPAPSPPCTPVCPPGACSSSARPGAASPSSRTAWSWTSSPGDSPAPRSP
ncbi:hypothetical protein ACFQ0M_46175 [Kitasatospora aburaviensis]